LSLDKAINLYYKSNSYIDEGEKLMAEGNKLWAEGYKLCYDSMKLFAESLNRKEQ